MHSIVSVSVYGKGHHRQKSLKVKVHISFNSLVARARSSPSMTKRINSFSTMPCLLIRIINPSLSLQMHTEQDLVLGAKGFHVSNPPIMQCMLLKASLNVFSTTSMTQLCLKSRLLTGYLELLIEENLLNDKVQPHSK